VSVGHHPPYQTPSLLLLAVLGSGVTLWPAKQSEGVARYGAEGSGLSFGEGPGRGHRWPLTSKTRTSARRVGISGDLEAPPCPLWLGGGRAKGGGVPQMRG